MQTLLAILWLLYFVGLIYTVVILPTPSEKMIIGICVAIVFPYAIIAGGCCVLELLVRLGCALGRAEHPPSGEITPRRHQLSDNQSQLESHMDDQDRFNKMGWLRPTMSGDDSDIIRALTETLPTTKSLDEAGMKQMERARAYMAELFLRLVSYRQFNLECGLYGFPVYPAQLGMTRHKLMGDAPPVYYKFWLLEKEQAVTATAVKNTLLFLKGHHGEEAAGYQVQVHLDVDNPAKNQTMPLDSGLTRRALCLEFALAEAEAHFAQIEAACSELCRHTHNKVRFGLGVFAEHEFADFGRLSVCDPRIPFGMAAEFVLFKSIHRRAKAQTAKRAAHKAAATAASVE